jgi:hypothetical protein
MTPSCAHAPQALLKTYTAPASEGSQLLAGSPYPGAAYIVGTGACMADVYRFYNIRTGTHFYTANSDERDQVQATLGHIYQYEGEAFYLQL